MRNHRELGRSGRGYEYDSAWQVPSRSAGMGRPTPGKRTRTEKLGGAGVLSLEQRLVRQLADVADRLRSGTGGPSGASPRGVASIPDLW
jgi:hypothetical protein